MKTKILLVILVLITGFAFAANPTPTQFNYNPSPAVPGSTITILIQVENADNYAKEDVMVKIDEKYPFTVKGQNEQNLGTLEKNGKKLVEYTIYVDPTAQNQTYPIDVMTKSKSEPNWVTTPKSIVIAGKKPIVKVMNISETKLVPGQEKEIIFTLQNVGTSAAYDILVELEEDRTVTATGVIVEREILPLGAATAHMSSLLPGDQESVTMKVSVNKEASLKNYTLPVTVSYRDSAGTIETETSYIGFKVSGLVEIDATIKDGGTQLIAGKSNEITIEMFNKGNGKADFIIAQIEADCGEAAKTKQFIGTLEPNDVDSFKTTINLGQSAKSGPCKIKVVLNYQDADASPKNKEIELSAPAYSIEDAAALAGGGINPLFVLVMLAIIGFVGYQVWKKMKNKSK
ncbi:MAG: hypothetical protein NTZ73_04730 [Candidatus Diapherotrites archaeon]|nr:hypothetical protein [Candidatus Diapherotrites archaeon]